jgi:CheY-like chemotaxis protein
MALHEQTPQEDQPARLALLVEDDSLVCTVVSRLLKSHGFTVMALSRPVDAIAAVQADAGRFEIVITDQSMPGMSGIELARAITALRPNLPIILISGYSLVADAKSPSANIRAFVRKPFTSKALGAAIVSALAQHHADDRTSVPTHDTAVTPAAERRKISG